MHGCHSYSQQRTILDQTQALAGTVIFFTCYSLHIQSLEYRLEQYISPGHASLLQA